MCESCTISVLCSTIANNGHNKEWSFANYHWPWKYRLPPHVVLHTHMYTHNNLRKCTYLKAQIIYRDLSYDKIEYYFSIKLNTMTSQIKHTHTHTHLLRASWSPRWEWLRPFPSSSPLVSPSLPEPPLFSKEPARCFPDEEGGRVGPWRPFTPLVLPLPTRSTLLARERERERERERGVCVCVCVHVCDWYM